MIDSLCSNVLWVVNMIALYIGKLFQIWNGYGFIWMLRHDAMIEQKASSIIPENSLYSNLINKTYII